MRNKTRPSKLSYSRSSNHLLGRGSYKENRTSSKLGLFLLAHNEKNNKTLKDNVNQERKIEYNCLLKKRL